MDDIANYICIGDSMSIDCYPHYDLSQRHPGAPEKVGAASLLYKNNLEIYPQFEGKDLISAHPKIQFCNLADDGATTFDFLDDTYLALLRGREKEPSILTVTLGGNDLLRIVTNEYSDVSREVDNVVLRYNQVIELITKSLPRAICILNTIYDPTDGTGMLPGLGDISSNLSWLKFVNDAIKETANKHCSLIADIHKHFSGHGVSAPEEERWYWKPNPIEPGAQGASEIRRLWYNLLAAEHLV